MANDTNAPANQSPEAPTSKPVPTDSAAAALSTDAADYTPGELTAFDYSAEPFADLSEQAQNALKELVVLASRTDVASRRFEVEQAWEARLFERGYQHLLPRRGGGWQLPGEGTKWGPLSTADSSALYSTNIYGRDKDIIVAAMSREVPMIQFFPQDSNNPTDVLTAEQANIYKDIYEKNNDLRTRLAELAYYYFTDDRAILYTRLVVDANKYGYNEDGTPAGREITSVYGKLEGKVPIQVSYQKEMQFIQLYAEIDVSTAKAKYPWVAKDIRPGSTGIGEIELDKIARVNTRLGLLGSYVTGDALQRDVTEQYTWVRPEMFFDPSVSDIIREELLEKFPKGALIICAGPTLVGARNEAMDDKLVVTHALQGNGQNRRALGTSCIAVQKRLNAYLDIMDDFHRRTVPRRIYHAEAFDVEALQKQDNIPGGSTPYLPQPGSTVQDLVFLEPTPQPQPSLPEFCKYYAEDLPASLDGAVPSLFGASTNTDTVGGIAIQRDQALGRIGVPWNAAKEAFSKAAHNAVCAAAERAGNITDTLSTGRAITIDPQQLRGNVVCYPEYDQSFPESWKERELRYTEIINGAATNPFLAALAQSPANLRAIADNVRMADLHIPGEDSAKKQLVEIDQLKNESPYPNPQRLMAETQFADITDGMNEDAANGVEMPPEADGMVQQLHSAIQSLPSEVSSVNVAPDESENHQIEAQVCFDWMNSTEGIKFKNGTAEQQNGFHNVYLHWQEHRQMAKQFAPPPQLPPPHLTIPYDKIPPEAQAQALARTGITTTPQSAANKKKIDTQHDIAKRVVPKTVPESINVHKLRNSNAPQPPPQFGEE